MTHKKQRRARLFPSERDGDIVGWEEMSNEPGGW